MPPLSKWLSLLVLSLIVAASCLVLPSLSQSLALPATLCGQLTFAVPCPTPGERLEASEPVASRPLRALFSMFSMSDGEIRVYISEAERGAPMPSLPWLWLGAWLVFWSLLHHVSFDLVLAVLRRFPGGAAAAREARQCYGALAHQKRVYLRRLLRAQVYYMVATVMGASLLYFDGRYPWMAFIRVDKAHHPDVLHDFLYIEAGEGARVCFAAALVHWLVSIVEDAASWRYLVAFSPDEDRITLASRYRCQMSFLMLCGYFWHHIVTFGAYAYCLYTRRLAILCCMGLQFEMPVMLFNVREFVVGFEAEINECFGGSVMLRIGRCRARIWWILTSLAVLWSRYGCLLLYVWSRIYWEDELAAVPAYVRTPYHFFGGFFCLIIPAWTAQLSMWWASDDYCIGELEKSARLRSALDLAGLADRTR